MTAVKRPDEERLREQILTALEVAGPMTPYTERLLIGELLPVVSAWAEQESARRAAEEIEQLADQRTWVTEHDNEVVSARDLYEQVARLRGELDPVTYDFPPDDAALTPATEEKP